ncbi:MAG: SufS family cysteine desulfurase, partial [Chloroflexi bacterium]|nr:SufS family cysteine desulfurase [Chloroflexota bacterium]
MTLNVASIREDFPILQQIVNGKPLIYLDSAATSQKPEAVIAAMDEYYRKINSNIHRGVYAIAEEATARYEAARKKVQKFINAKSFREIIFTRNATEALNLVSYTWARANIHAGDEIVSTLLEHHSNIVPWQLLAQEKGATLKFIRVDDQGLLLDEDIATVITEKTKLVAATMMSNVAGTITPIKQIIARAHAVGAVVVVDGAQGVPHIATDVQQLDCDFLAFSGHKMLAPFVGILYGKRALLEAMPPFMGGGDMIREVYLDHSSWNDLPYKFEAGTPAIAEGIGIGAAVDYLNALGMENVRAHERDLVAYALAKISELDHVRVVGPLDANLRGGVVAFHIPEAHPHDIATIFDREGICVRAGHHCAMPLHEFYGLSATTRASFYVYNIPD